MIQLNAMNMKQLFIFLLITMWSFSVWGQLGTYSFSGDTECPSNGAGIDAQPMNASFADFSRTNTVCSDADGVFSTRSWCTSCADASAIDFTEYLEFSITADAGFEVTATSLDFLQRGSNTVADEFRVAVSNNNFSTTTAFMDFSVPTSNSNESWDFTDISSGNGGTITFRFYVYGDVQADGVGTPSSAGTFRVDNVSLFGSVSGALPIELLSFDVEKTEKKVIISWETAQEINNDYMAIERSKDGRDFTEIGRLKGMGNTTERQTYQFIDQRPQHGLNYYRLKQVDFDGTYEYHRTSVVTFHEILTNKLINVYPTTADDRLYIELQEDIDSDVLLYIVGIDGKIWSQIILKDIGNSTVTYSVANLPVGNYWLRINYEQNNHLAFFQKL